MIACAASVNVAFALCVVAAVAVFAVAVWLDHRRRPRPDAGRPITPTSPMSPRRTPTRPPAETRLVPLTGIGVNDVATGPEDLGPYVGGPPVAARHHQPRTAVTRPRVDLPVKRDW